MDWAVSAYVQPAIGTCIESVMNPKPLFFPGPRLNHFTTSGINYNGNWWQILKSTLNSILWTWWCVFGILRIVHCIDSMQSLSHKNFSRCAILQSVPQLHHNPSEQTTNGFFCFLAMLIGRRDVFCCSAEPLCSMYGTPSPYVNKKTCASPDPDESFFRLAFFATFGQ